MTEPENLEYLKENERLYYTVGTRTIFFIKVTRQLFHYLKKYNNEICSLPKFVVL